jgi:phytoene desaturase
MLYLGIRGRYEMPHHNIFFATDYRRNVEEITRGVLSDDPSFYVQNAAATDPTLAPEGKSTLYVLVPVPSAVTPGDWSPDRTRRFRDRLLRLLAQRAGLADLEDRIEFERVITPDDWQVRHDVYRGAVFNLAHTLSQMLYLRPHNRFQEFERCYLVGGGTHPGSGLPTIYESGRIAADLIAHDLAGHRRRTLAAAPPRTYHPVGT